MGSGAHSLPSRRIVGFDRTPLLLGVMIIPLAATCALACGTATFRVMPQERGPAELRVVFADRERRDLSAEMILAEAGHQEDTRRHFHRLPAYAAYTNKCAAAVPVSAPISQSISGFTPVPGAPHLAAHRERGPPHG